MMSTSQTAKIAALFVLWYATSCVSGTTTKSIMHSGILPDAVALLFVQLSVSSGVVAAFIRAGHVQGITLRAWPTDAAHRTAVLAITACYIVGFMTLQGGMRFVNVSLAVTCRAFEPVVTCGLGRLMGEHISRLMMASLVPIVAGVSLSAASDMSFTAMGCALLAVADLAFSLRSVFVKQLQRTPGSLPAPKGTSLFFMVCVGGAAMVAVILMGRDLGSAGDPFKTFWKVLLAMSSDPLPLLVNGLCFAVYNCTSYALLGMIDLSAHAVSNSMRQLFVIVYSVWWFGNKISWINAVGIVMAIGGAGLFNKAKNQVKRERVLRSV